MTHFHLLCAELQLDIAKQLDFKTIQQLALTDNLFSTLLQDEELWKTLLQRDWRVSPQLISDLNPIFPTNLSIYKRITKLTLNKNWTGHGQWLSPPAPSQYASATLRFKPGTPSSPPTITGFGTTFNRETLPWRITDGKFVNLTVHWKKHVDGHVCNYDGHLDIVKGYLHGFITYNEEKKGVLWSGVWRYDLIESTPWRPNSNPTPLNSNPTSPKSNPTPLNLTLIQRVLKAFKWTT